VNIQSLLVTLSVPKFDVSSGINLTDPLKSLGITDVFDSAVADFTPLTQESSISLSQAQHSARVTIDENGCTAAAFTILGAEGGALIDVDEIDFILDRPFIFAITSLDNSILFIGTVNSPVK
ncbi:MAG: serpin family protein, partial [Oscillospiraceae bacterium]|nr:serpin family protein [Oscillospiraceae bacterium]